MSKSKMYLPLEHCKFQREQWWSFIKDIPNIESLLPLANQEWIENGEDSFDATFEKISATSATREIFQNCIGAIKLAEKYGGRPMDIASKSFWIFTLLERWGANKQVFALDADFIDELWNTEEITFTKGAWDYLPYSTFYLDLSAHRELCKLLEYEGLLVSVNKIIVNGEEKYDLQVGMLGDPTFSYATMCVSNSDASSNKNDIRIGGGMKEFLRAAKRRGEDPSKHIEQGWATTSLLYSVLTYLSSIEPDIKENPETKATYRKPAGIKMAKNKYSEIQKWDVGVRFGSAFRAWQKQATNELNISEQGEHGPRSKMRPHSRRAHWSHYWYGHGDEKIRRAKWVSECFVNINFANNKEQPVVIHEVEAPTVANETPEIVEERE